METVIVTRDPEAEIFVPPAAPVREVTVLDILLALARRRRLIAWSTLGLGAAALLVACVLPSKFTATTVILPPQKSQSIESSMLSEIGSLGALGSLAGSSLGIKNPNDMYVALFKSDAVVDGMIRQFDLQREYHSKYLFQTRAQFADRSTVKADTKTGLISVSVTDHNPARAAAMANAYVDQYRHLSEHLAISEASQRRLFFQEQMVGAKNDLANAEAALVKTEQSTGLVGLDAQARALIGTAASLRAEVTAKQVQIQGMETYAGEDNASLVQAKKELAGLEDQLARLGGSGDLDAGSLMVPKGQVPEATLEYARKLRDVKYYETIFNILARQFETAKLDEAREGALVQVVDPALVPEHKSAPKRLYWLIGGLFLGFFMSCAYVLWKAALRFLRQDGETDMKLTALREAMRWRPSRSGNHA